MSIEKNIERIANAVEKLVALAEAQPATAVHMGEVTVEATAPAPTPEPAAPAAPAQPAAMQAPFTDDQSLVAYVMKAYSDMGAEKGAGIQGILTEMGTANIHDVPAEKYDELYTKVEALRNS